MSMPRTYAVPSLGMSMPVTIETGGGLTGAVAADQSVEGSGGDVEVDAVDGDLLAECLGEAADFDGGAGASGRCGLRGDG